MIGEAVSTHKRGHFRLLTIFGAALLMLMLLGVAMVVASRPTDRFGGDTGAPNVLERTNTQNQDAPCPGNQPCGP